MLWCVHLFCTLSVLCPPIHCNICRVTWKLWFIEKDKRWRIKSYRVILVGNYKVLGSFCWNEVLDDFKGKKHVTMFVYMENLGTLNYPSCSVYTYSRVYSVALLRYWQNGNCDKLFLLLTYLAPIWWFWEVIRIVFCVFKSMYGIVGVGNFSLGFYQFCI